MSKIKINEKYTGEYFPYQINIQKTIEKEFIDSINNMKKFDLKNGIEFVIHLIDYMPTIQKKLELNLNSFLQIR